MQTCDYKPDKLTLYLVIYWSRYSLTSLHNSCVFILPFLASLGVARANHLPPSNAMPINLLCALPLGHLPAASQPQNPPACIFTISPRHLSQPSLALSTKHSTWTLWWPHPWPSPSKSPPHKSTILFNLRRLQLCLLSLSHHYETLPFFSSVSCHRAVQFEFLLSSSTPPHGFCSRNPSTCQHVHFDTLRSTGWMTEEAGKSWLAAKRPRTLTLAWRHYKYSGLCFM